MWAADQDFALGVSGVGLLQHVVLPTPLPPCITLSLFLSALLSLPSPGGGYEAQRHLSRTHEAPRHLSRTALLRHDPQVTGANGAPMV